MSQATGRKPPVFGPEPWSEVAGRLWSYWDAPFHTAGLELMERAGDSYGNVGQMREEAWHTYLELDWQAAGMKPEDYWADIGDLVVFEDYGLGFKQETRPWLHVPAGQAEMIEDYLHQLERECRAAFFDYQADEARQQLAWLAVAGRRFSARRDQLCVEVSFRPDPRGGRTREGLLTESFPAFAGRLLAGPEPELESIGAVAMLRSRRHRGPGSQVGRRAGLTVGVIAVKAFAHDRYERLEESARVLVEGLGHHAFDHPAQRLAGQVGVQPGSQPVPLGLDDASREVVGPVGVHEGAVGAVEVLEIPHNPGRKAGALNAGLRQLLPRLSPNDAVLQADGDTILEPQLVEALAQSLEKNERVGASSCAYFAKPYKGLLSALQQAEFAMERRRIQRRRGVPACLSGVATLFRVQCFHDLAAARGAALPGAQSDFYLPGSLTEDYELTLALRTIGYELRSPERAVAWTDVMTDWGSLWKQRLCWQRGTLETLGLYGRRRCTWRPWLEQALTYLSMMMPVHTSLRR